MTEDILDHYIWRERRMEEMASDIHSACAAARLELPDVLQGKAGDALEKKMQQVEDTLRKTRLDLQDVRRLLMAIPPVNL